MAFAIRIVKLKNYLNEQKHEYNIADQIQRSGTAIGANHREAIAAESEVDAGCGALDFKFSSGGHKKVIIEIFRLQCQKIRKIAKSDIYICIYHFFFVILRTKMHMREKVSV